MGRDRERDGAGKGGDGDPAARFGRAALSPGDTFDRYSIEGLLGEGGMGCVYSAHDSRLGRKVALKVIAPRNTGADGDARLIREARAAAALDHPNAVSIFDVGELNGAPYIVMELVTGRTLRGSIGSAAATMDATIGWLVDVARALAAAHKRGIVHRDIKPENVMVREDGVVKVLDFGIARRSGGGGGADPHASTEAPALPTLTVEGVKLGTPVYMAPEQVRGEALDGRTDQFAWGVLAFELFTGRLPWRGAEDAFAVIASILTDEVDGSALDRASVSPAVRDVILRALSKRREDRFPSMDDAAKALLAAARGEAPPEPRAAPAASTTDAQRYSTAEVREVLARAIEKEGEASAEGAKLGFSDVLAAAREVGVGEVQLREASRAMRKIRRGASLNPEQAAERDAWIRKRRLEFFRHAGVYAIVHGALLGVGLLIPFLAPHVIYLGIVALLWGIGLAIHGLIALTSNEDDWAEHEEGMEWWREARRHRRELAIARVSGSQGGRRELGEGRARVRVEVPPSAGRAGAVGGAGASASASAATDTDANAEAEAEAAVEAPKRRRRRS